MEHDVLIPLIGVEHDLDQVGAVLARFARSVGADAVGAYHVACSDESEREMSAAFDRGVADTLLPELKPERRAVFQSVNLGARYEWGAIRVAEEHFATPTARQSVKLLVTKLNSHVAVHQEADELTFGWLERYGDRSACCGALRGMLEGSLLPSICELRDMMAHDGYDRCRALADPRRVPEHAQALHAAIVNAVLQSQRVVKDIGEYRPESPTLFLVLPSVTLNRPGRDTELIVGYWGIDRTARQPQVRYAGLGDDPTAYEHRLDQQRLIVSDPQWSA
jgi:hypothetical protein